MPKKIVADKTDPFYQKSVEFGKQAVALTNEYRISQKLSPVTWSQELHDVGFGHSKNMADTMSMGHFGFSDRANSLVFDFNGVSENVAYNFGHPNPVKVCVDGWIKSEGHRKNMISNVSQCGVSVYSKDNYVYTFTQLFGTPSF
jgi:uncharacterized protein YkwD